MLVEKSMHPEWLSNAFVVAAEGGPAVFVDSGAEFRVPTENGILASASDGKRVVIGGDDGKVITIDAAGSAETIATDPKGRWIDRVALGPDAVAWSAGKQAFVRTAKGETRGCEFPTSPGGLAFAPKGLRLAIAHYNGVSLWFPNADAAPERLEWKGSHLGVTFSPNGHQSFFSMASMMRPRM